MCINKKCNVECRTDSKSSLGVHTLGPKVNQICRLPTALTAALFYS
jgi:hypothetical protein